MSLLHRCRLVLEPYGAEYVPKTTASVFDGFSSSLFVRNHRQTSSTHSESVLNGSVAERGRNTVKWTSAAECHQRIDGSRDNNAATTLLIGEMYMAKSMVPFHQ